MNISGYLEIFEKGFGFLRQIDCNFQQGCEDIYVPAQLIRSNRLREGLFLRT